MCNISPASSCFFDGSSQHHRASSASSGVTVCTITGSLPLLKLFPWPIAAFGHLRLKLFLCRLKLFPSQVADLAGCALHGPSFRGLRLKLFFVTGCSIHHRIYSCIHYHRFQHTPSVVVASVGSRLQHPGWLLSVVRFAGHSIPAGCSHLCSMLAATSHRGGRATHRWGAVAP